MSCFTVIYKKCVLLALVAMLFLSICPVEHLFPIAEAEAHTEVADSDCPDEPCGTILKSNTFKTSLATAQASVVLLPPSFTSTTGIFSFRWESLAKVFDFAPPGSLHKYHSVYRI